MRRQSSTNKKRATLFSALLSVIFIFAMISTMLIIAEAKENPTMTLQVSQESAFAGETVQVKINLVGNPGVASLKINVAYENFLTLQNIEYNPSLGGQASSSNYQQGGSPATLIWVNAFEDFTDDAVFATLTFKIADDAEEDAVSEISVTYDEDDIYDSEEENITLIVKNGSVTVQSSVPGDINGDKKVNNKDITRMFQHLANWGVSVNSSVLDVNGDGKINNKDITRLFQYLANWDVDIYPISYIVTFNGNGGTLVSGRETQTVKKVTANGAASAIAPVYEKEGFALDGFDKDFSNVTSNITVTAQWKVSAHVHTFSDEWTFDDEYHWHASICEHDSEVSEYSAHSFNEGVCTICGYTQDLTYIVTFADYNNTIIDIQEVQKGLSAVAPANPSRTGYRFTGWDKTFNNINEDTTVTAQYIQQFIVTFKDWNGSTLKTQTVDSGAAATAPVDPIRDKYIFSGWDKAYTNITANTTVTAVYTIKTFTVTFKMPDGTIIPYVDYRGVEHSTQTVEYGSCAEAPNYSSIFTELYFDWNTTSMKEFSGWDKELTNITNDTVIKAEYKNYYVQPVIAMEQIEKTISVKIYMPEATHLYAIDFNLGWTGSIGVGNYFIDEASNVLYLTDNVSKNIDYNNKQKSFHYSWTYAKGIKAPTNDEYLDVVEITFSTSGGAQLNIESIQKDFTLVFGTTSDLPVENLTVLNPIVVIR